IFGCGGGKIVIHTPGFQFNLIDIAIAVLNFNSAVFFINSHDFEKIMGCYILVPLSWCWKKCCHHNPPNRTYYVKSRSQTNTGILLSHLFFSEWSWEFDFRLCLLEAR